VKSIYHSSSPEVAEALAATRTVVIPLGSVEQHGPHLPCGTDTMAAELVAAEVAERLDALLVPFGPYGVTPIHAGHPGTISLDRATFEALLRDICGQLVAGGARWFLLVNWHEGNIASMDAVAMELQKRHPGVYVVSAQACYVAQEIYADEGGELTHGGGIEAMAVMAYDPSLVKLEEAPTAARSERASALDRMRRGRKVYGYITDVTEIDREGWYGDPAWATRERAETFSARVADEIVREFEQIRKLRLA
jgi:creatinine amidohydrolase